ncbi:MAG TPA: hypothetical protein IAA05_04115 [Candidatus Blautia excrementipullorum]|nr:hypothetical protein [Candidatus Blautia excrementipullorum]
MKKYKFLCSEKAVAIICLVACLIVLLYELSGGMFQNNELLYSFLKIVVQISYSIIASTFFYFFTVYIRWIRKKALFENAITNKRKSIKNAVERIWKLYLGGSYSLHDVTEEKIAECSEKIRMNDLCGVFGGINEQYNFLEFFGNQATYILNVIDQIYVKLANYMDEEELAILQEIADCQFLRELENDYTHQHFVGYYFKNPTFKSRKDQIIDFYRLWVKYEKFLKISK